MQKKSYLKRTPKSKDINGYKIYDVLKGTFVIYHLDDLKYLGEYLPARCKDIVEQMDNDPNYKLKYQDQKDLLQLLSLSISPVWGGSPKNKLPEVLMEDYRNTYYITMFKYLRKFDRSKGCWVAQCKYAAFDTVDSYVMQWKRERKLNKKLEEQFYKLQEEYPELWEKPLDKPLESD